MKIVQVTSKNGTKAMNKTLAEGVPNPTGGQNLWLEDEEGRAFQVQLTPEDIIKMVFSGPAASLINKLDGDPTAPVLLRNMLKKALGG